MLQHNGMPNATCSFARATASHSLVTPLAMAGTQCTPPPGTSSLPTPDAELAGMATPPRCEGATAGGARTLWGSDAGVAHPAPCRREERAAATGACSTLLTVGSSPHPRSKWAANREKRWLLHAAAGERATLGCSSRLL
jgi:hypothetical protein